VRTALDFLATALCDPGAAPSEPVAAAPAPAECLVVIPAGGFGYRMRGAVEGPGGAVNQKSLLPLPNGETLIDRVIRQYAGAGFADFLALVNFEGREVETHVGSGERWGVRVRFSYDPDATGSGRTGALLHAEAQGLVPQDRPLVVHNADCQIYGYPGSFPADLLAAHGRAVAAADVTATLAAVDGTPYPFTGMSVAGGLVREVEMYPFIPVPTHTGITILTPRALADLRANALASRKNFESDLFPRWAAAGNLGAMVIPYARWVAVDDRKAYRNFCAAVAEEKA
jgi:NDP-sugar pyrophosphorylase family protein